MPSVVRRQAAGSLRTDPGQAVGVGLRAACIFRYSDCISGRLPYLRGLCRANTTRKRLDIMSVAGQLLYRERGLADSAGKTFLIAAMRHNQELFHASSYRSSR